MRYERDESEFAELEERLASLKPRRESVTREQMLFEAGRAAGRAEQRRCREVRRWKMATLATGAVALLLLTLQAIVPPSAKHTPVSSAVQRSSQQSEGRATSASPSRSPSADVDWRKLPAEVLFAESTAAPVDLVEAAFDTTDIGPADSEDFTESESDEWDERDRSKKEFRISTWEILFDGRFSKGLGELP